MYIDPYELTKIDLAALKQANYLLVAHNRSVSEPSCFQAVKEFAKTETNPFPVNAYHTMLAPVSVQYNYRTPNAKYVCFESIWLYRPDHATSILDTLRAGDAISFMFYPDARSNGYLEDAGIHGDTLYLNVYRKGKHCARFELASSICKDNSARMCRMTSAGQLAIA